MTGNLYTRTALVLLGVGAALLLLGCEEQLSFPQTGSISVTSTPSGARIFLDRSDTGRVTPYVIPDVSAGSHGIRLTLAGHSDWEQRNVPVSAGQITTVHAPLQPTDRPQEPDVPSERGLGLKRMDVQAYQSAHVIRADPISVPSFVDLSVDAPIPGNQGLQGSCVGWAVAYALKTYQERIERGWPLTDDRHVMSPAYIYNQIKVPGGGSYFVDAFILLLNEGVSSWAQMPYDPSDDRTQPGASARAEADNYKIADWGTVLRNTHQVFVQEIKRHLAAGTPLVVGIPVHPDFDNLSESNPVYDDDSGAYQGAHAVVIVGYDDRRSAFKIINSWGTDWGIGGYGWIDYDASEGLIWEIYVTEDVVASPDDERPRAASDPQPGSEATGVALDTVLRWTRNARTTSFDVYLGTDANLGANDFQGSVAQAAFTPHLAPESRYYWRIDARGAGGITRGPVWTFTTAGTLEEPGKAVNPSPADGATGVAQSAVLSWDSGGRATSYDVYLGADPVLGASELQQTQATRTYSPRGLRAGTRYYWRIDARNGQGTTTGDVWSFTTAVQLGPRKATGPQPEHGATDVNILEDLSWSAVPGAISYIVYFGTAASPGNAERQGEQVSTTLDVVLQYDTTYYWRIDARNSQGITTGDVWWFTTAQARDRDTSPALPSIGDKTYLQGVTISTWALPKATGGAGQVTYSLLEIPPGLSVAVGDQKYYFWDWWTVPSDSDDSFLLSGTPIEAGTYNLRYEVRDSYGNTDSVSFTITVTVHCNTRFSPRGKIYWSSPRTGEILRANLSGTDVETIYYRPPVPSAHNEGQYLTRPVGIAISGDKIYWVDESGVGVRRANLDGTCVERLVIGGDAPLAIAIADGKMYWTDYNHGDKIKRANLDGTRIEALYSGTEMPSDITVFGDKMYWTSGTRKGDFDRTGVGVRRANLDGSGMELLVTGIADPYGVAVTANKIYWTDRVHWEVSGGGKIQRANLDGTNVETVISNLRQPLAIVIHSNRVYWIENHGAIKSANIDGTDVESLVSPDGMGSFGRGLAVR